MNREIEKYKAIGEATRLRLLRLLVESKEELCVCELVDVLGKPQYTVSKSLSVLKRAELVEERRNGKMMFYKLVHSPFNDTLFQSVSRLPADDPLYSGDSKKLVKRLELRKNGRCVVTYRRSGK